MKEKIIGVLIRWEEVDLVVEVVESEEMEKVNLEAVEDSEVVDKIEHKSTVCFLYLMANMYC